MRIIGKDVDATREATVVASGTLPNGKPVVVNADGTVSVVSENSISEGVGSNVTFESAGTTFIGSAYDATAQKVVIAYQDGGNSSYGTAVVGTVSGTGITFGTPVVFSTSSFGTNNISVAYNSGAGKTIICCNESESFEDGVVYVGTVSGTSISFGSRQVFSSVSGNPVKADIAYDNTNNKIVIAYEESGNVFKGIVGTVSGTSVTFGSATTIVSSTIAEPRVLHDTVNNKIVVLYKGTSDYGYAVVGTVSGTSITFGSIVTFNSAQTLRISGAYDSSNGKVVVSYKDGGNSSYGESAVGTVSGTSISFGTPVVFESAVVDWISSAYNAAAGKVIIAYQDKGNADTGTYVEGTVSGTSISFDTPTTFPSTADAIYTSVAYDSDQYASIISFMNIDNASYGTSFSYQSAGAVSNLTAENYIGISDGDIDTITQSESVGTPSVYATTEALQSDLAYDSASGKMVLAWRDSNNTNGHGKAVVITVSGTTLSYGTPVTFNAASTRIPKVVFDSANNKIVIAYRNDGNNNYSTAIVGTVSGTSISFGTPVVWKSANNSGIGATYDPDNSKVIVGSAGTGAGAYEVFVGTVSGTSISFGSSSGSLGTAYSGELAYDEANNKVIAALHMYPSTGSTFVGTVSGTSISFGSANNITTSGFSDIWGLVYDSANSKMVICYQANGLYSIVGTVSGTTMTFGSATNVQAASNDADIVYDSLLNKPIVAFKDVGNTNNGTVKVGTVSGTSISFGSATVYETGDATQNAIGFDSGEGKSVISYSDGDNSYYGNAVVYQAAGSYDIRGETPNGGDVKVLTQGSVSDLQSGLTSGKSYYVQANGTLSTTAGNPSVFAGTAVSATKLIVKG